MKFNIESTINNVLKNWIIKLLKNDLKTSVEGDLLEQYYLDLAEHGARRAKWNMIREVLGLLRPNLIRRPSVQFNERLPFRQIARVILQLAVSVFMASGYGPWWRPYYINNKRQ